MDRLKEFYENHLKFIQAKDKYTATLNDKFKALAYAVRSQMLEQWINTQKAYRDTNPRRIYFLSMEYILGKNLKHNVINLKLQYETKELLKFLGITFDELMEEESDLLLGNPSLGSFAANALDSMATMGIPGMGYGLHYDYALFRQKLVDGVQLEQPYDWLHKFHPWEIERPEYACRINFRKGKKKSNSLSGWHPTDNVVAVPRDVTIPGYDNGVIHTLRLWSAQASEEFLGDYQNHRDYIRACEEKFLSGRITNYLFPDADVHRATEMRIKQQYFFVSASLKDIIRRFKLSNANILDLHEKIVIHLNGSRCALAIPELMRILVDNEGVSWEDAWSVTRSVFSFTNHSIGIDNALKLPIYMLDEILPRHVEIIRQINEWHLEQVVSETGTENYSQSSIIEEGEVQWVRLSYLAVVASFSINGVSFTQTNLLKKNVQERLPQSILNKITCNTPGIAIRRWVLSVNPELSSLLTECIGEKWITDFAQVRRFEQFHNDPEILRRLSEIKKNGKILLSNRMKSKGVGPFDPEMLLDVHCRRIHPHKRQILHLFYIVEQYLNLKDGVSQGIVPRVHLFGGRASPTDLLAKQIILLTHIIINEINSDPAVKQWLQVYFVENYGVNVAEDVVPAADVSEQLATPNMESCGTSNMRFAVNGAITIGSRSGANLEMIKHIGEDNLFIFGHSSEELETIDTYEPSKVIRSEPVFERIFTFLDSIVKKHVKGNEVLPFLSTIKDSDPYFALLEYESYVKAQREVGLLYQNPKEWYNKTILTISRSGWFSNDRSVIEFADKIWKVTF